jgi:hypothetical protein
MTRKAICVFNDWRNAPALPLGRRLHASGVMFYFPTAARVKLNPKVRVLRARRLCIGRSRQRRRQFPPDSEDRTAPPISVNPY